MRSFCYLSFPIQSSVKLREFFQDDIKKTSLSTRNGLEEIALHILSFMQNQYQVNEFWLATWFKFNDKKEDISCPSRDLYLPSE